MKLKLFYWNYLIQLYNIEEYRPACARLIRYIVFLNYSDIEYTQKSLANKVHISYSRLNKYLNEIISIIINRWKIDNKILKIELLKEFSEESFIDYLKNNEEFIDYLKMEYKNEIN